MDPQQSQPESSPTLPPSVTQPPHAPAPSRMGIKHLLLVVIVALLLIGGGIGLGFYLRGNPTPTATDTSKEQGTQSSNTPTQSSTNSADTLDGMQMRARDTERQTDINSIATQLEVYYNSNGSYPSFAQVSDDTWVEANLVGIDLEALRPPQTHANAMQNTKTPDKYHYGYVMNQADPKTCPDSTYVCSKFTLYWYQESTGKVITKDSLN